MADRDREFGRMRQARLIGELGFCLLKGGTTISQAAGFAAGSGFVKAADVLRAAIPGGTLNAPGWAADIADASAASAAFLDLLRVNGAFDGMLADTLRLPGDVGGVRLQTSAVTGDTPGEGAAIPVHALNFDAPTGARFFSAAIVIVSKQVLALAPDKAVSLIEAELRAGCIAGVDARFVSILAAGALSITSSGATAAAVRTDLRTAADEMALGSASRLYLLVPSSTARHLAFMTDTAGGKAFAGMTVRGGDIDGVRVIPTDALANVGSPAFASPLLVDASRVAAWSETIGLDRAEHAAFEMTSTPTAHVGGVGSPDAPVAPSTMVSLFQTNAIALRASRWWRAQKLTDTCVCEIAGAAW